MRGSEWHRARMTAREFSSASADAGVRRRRPKISRISASSMFFTRACSQSTKTSTLTTGVVVSESPHEITTPKRGSNFRDYSIISGLGFGPRTMWYSTMFPPKVLRLRVAFAINNNLNMTRNSNVVQLSAIGQLWCKHHGVLEVDATRGRRRETRGPKPRPETEARNEK